MPITVDQILVEIEQLSVEQRVQLRDRLDQLSARPKPQMTEEEFEQHLLKIGLISQLPDKTPLTELWSTFKPVEVRGKPVSETIIEERR